MTSSPGSISDAFASADRNDDIIVWIIVHLKASLMVIADLPAQFEQALIGRIVGLSVLDGINGCVADVPGRAEIRLSHTERDHPFDLAGKIEEAADAAGRDRSDTLRQDLFIIHGVTTSRSPLCLRSSSRMMPLSLYCFRTNSVTVDFTASMQAILSATKLATSYMLLP